MNPKFTYTRRNPDVQAVWWNGDNRDEVIEFFRDCGLPESEGPYFSTFEDFQFDGYNAVKAGGCGGLEVDFNSWIVYNDEDYRPWTRTEFRAIFGIDVPS